MLLSLTNPYTMPVKEAQGLIIAPQAVCPLSLHEAQTDLATLEAERVRREREARKWLLSQV